VKGQGTPALLRQAPAIQLPSPLLPTAEGIDKPTGSTKMKRRTPQDGPDLARCSDNEGHRDFLARVDSMANK